MYSLYSIETIMPMECHFDNKTNLCVCVCVCVCGKSLCSCKLGSRFFLLLKITRLEMRIFPPSCALNFKYTKSNSN